jgi:peptidoglycan/LPS O-acetylase OafA/YrhL
MWAHFPFVAGSPVSQGIWKVSQVLRTGYIGVDLFFVLSGFLITRILLEERGRTGGISLRSFFAKRALRILPIYYLGIAIYAAVFAWSSGDLLSLATHTFNYYKPFHPEPMALEHTWSLSVEEQFYLVWPFALLAIPARLGKVTTSLLIPLVSVLAALFIAATFESALSATMIYMFSITRMMSLSLGASIAYGEQEGDQPGGWQAGLVILIGVAVLAVDQAGRYLQIVPAGGYYWSVALVGYAMMGFGTVSLLVAPAGRMVTAVNAALSWAPLRYVGRISYGLYLYHYLVLFLLNIAPYQTEKSGASASRLLAAVVLTFVCAHLSYRYFERPLMRLRDRPRLLQDAVQQA